MEYGSADIALTSFASSPMLHLLEGIAVSYPGSLRSSVKRRWWRDVRRLLPARAMPLFKMVNAVPGYTPAFMVPELSGPGGPTRRSLDDELEALRAIAIADVATESAAYAGTSATGPSRMWAELLDDSRAVSRMVDAVRALFAECSASDWPDLQRRVGVEIAMRGQQMATEGVGAVLNSLHPQLAWREDALVFETTADWVAPEGPGGRGFTLFPNAMSARMSLLTLETRQPVLTYGPISARPAAGAHPSALHTLIGAGRARALRAIGDGCSTAGLAARLGLKAPAASEHAAALRAAGLLITVRDGRSVRHTLTDLGSGLLAANPL